MSETAYHSYVVSSLIAWYRKEMKSCSSCYFDKPQNPSFPWLSFVFVINIHNHRSGESDCREYLHVLISELSGYIYLSFLFCNLMFRPHLPHCSQFYFLSQQYSLYMKGWINTDRALSWVSSAISVPFLYIATQQINKEFLENLLNISRLSKKSW